MNTRLIKIPVSITPLFTVCLLLIAATVLNTGEATGTVSVEICQKTADGKWEVIDRGKAPIQCALSYSGAPTNAAVSSSPTWSWSFTSEKGRRVSATILRAGKARFDASTGALELELPIEVNVDGKRERLSYKQTTESLSTVIGTLSGKRLTTTADGFSGATVGVGILRNRELINYLCNTSGRKSPVNELVVVLRSEGRATLKK
ncbi:MAG TPA: hypothetical protein VFZ34_28630 [Blastocatellia bacterium]|nr:hypothetical protein [Blastocatellia bacterium]